MYRIYFDEGFGGKNSLITKNNLTLGWVQNIEFKISSEGYETHKKYSFNIDKIYPNDYKPISVPTYFYNNIPPDILLEFNESYSRINLKYLNGTKWIKLFSRKDFLKFDNFYINLNVKNNNTLIINDKSYFDYFKIFKKMNYNKKATKNYLDNPELLEII